MPSLCLAIHTTRLVWAKDTTSRDSLLKSHKCYKIIAKVYVGVFVILALFACVAGYVASFFDQLEMQYISSF